MSLLQYTDIFSRKFDSNELTVSVDGAWQKRGCGRSYDSLSGMYNVKILKLLRFSFFQRK